MRQTKPKWILRSNFMGWMPESAAETRKQCWLNGIAYEWPDGDVTDWHTARMLMQSEFYRPYPYSQYEKEQKQEAA